MNNSVHITVGSGQSGKRYTLAKADIQKHKDSNLYTLVNSQNTNEITIARDHHLFDYVFDFVTTGKVKPIRNAEKIKKVEHEFAFFKLPFSPSPSLHLVSPRAKVTAELMTDATQEAIKKWLPNLRFRLLYKATMDGFHATGFHHFCDDKGPTLTLIRVKKHDKDCIFGGYSPISWLSQSYGSYKSHPECFLFTICNPHDLPPTKYPLKKASANAVFLSSDTCASFGSGCDLKVSPNANLHSDSYTNFPHDYEDTTGKGHATFTGAKQFHASEVEVYGIS